MHDLKAYLGFRWVKSQPCGRTRAAVLLYKRPPLVRGVDMEYRSEEMLLNIERDESDSR